MKLVSLSREEVYNFVNSQAPKEPYKMKGHSWTPLKGTGKQYCKGCGLVALNTPLAVWCIDRGCFYEDHPQFNSTKKRLTKMKEFS